MDKVYLNDSAPRMEDIVRNPAGEVVRARTKRMRVQIYRPQYSGADGTPRWAKRFYYSKMVNGVLARFPLASDAKAAETLADQIAAFLELTTSTLTDARRRFNPRALARPSQFSTVGELLEFHQEHRQVIGISEATAKGYGTSLIVILRRVDAFRRGIECASWSGRKPKPEELSPWLERSLLDVNARVATDYQRLMVPNDIEDEEEEITQKITCDMNLRSAKCLFSREAMKVYKRSETLLLPDMTDFLSVSLYNAKKFFVLPEVGVIKKIFTAAPELRASDLNAYRAFLVCVQAGMRKTEAASFRMDWLRDEDTPVILIHEDGKFKPKHGHGRKVLLDPWVAAEIRALAGDRKYLLDGSDTERTEDVFDRLNAWLRKQGVDATKPTHELRKLWFSQKVKRESVLAAAQQGGHRDVKMTQSFYADAQMPDNVLPFWQEPTLAALARLKTA